MLWCTSDYGLVQLIDGIGYDASKTLNNPPKTGEEGWAVAFDPVSSDLYISIGTKYKNAAGEVYYLPSGSTTWIDCYLSLAGTTNPLASDTFSRSVTNGWVEAAAAATAAALSPSNTYTPGSGGSGVGATLTGTSHGALVVDGYTVVANDLILVQNEANQANNGLYTVTTKGGTGAAYVLTRHTDMNQPSQFPFAAYAVANTGSVNAGLCFACTTPSPVTFGTTAITWTQTSPLGGPWTIAAVSTIPFSVTNGSGNIQLSSSTASHFVFLEKISNLASSGQVKITWTAEAAGASHVADLILRSTDNTENNCYRIRITQTTAGVVTAVIQGVIGGDFN